MTTDLIIIGAANPLIIRVIDDINAESGNKFNVLGFVDNNWMNIGKEKWGITVFPGFDSLSDFDRTNTKLINAIAGSMKTRKETTAFFIERGWSFANIFHPRINLKYTTMGSGNIIYESAVIQPYVEIGDHCVVSVLSGIGHESKLGNCCFVGPNSYICGKVNIGNEVYIGTGASILPRLHIGSNATIGAGSLVNSDIPDNTRVKGVPAREY
ncbi:MAG: NeuD/PglB/VioB family sugar acetyltransferase [Desulfobacterales bacterium]|jgi:UDP-perosamine 4-acetyltransferase|nr:NeuD/PglB/VioB family sugar acetyltransferase [Desulfobacterales bacterium]MDD3080907.1 NeuD/PglB/VioB family sugar acetyltransferase [Desulfobacterales bacterium]MDD3951638.1 NeuD/PglB/VioB family sugar acetyltransferase [Desulfobacterales bacterium]MDD4431568.1 NeuD/PglB/VioB family sugar acetyltransferase [Bacteroidales bacterium]MDY0377920.1 NeuD/PglB/VioB family sugar acetyltransferase [Desulfobacterales bacterium]